jgi:hypothetical protein
VFIDPSTYDQSCKVDADCVPITAGDICTGACLCGGVTINRSGQARYDAAISGIMPGPCLCPAQPVPQCIGGTCGFCTGGPTDPPGCGGTVQVDAGPVVCIQTGGTAVGVGDAGMCSMQASEKCTDGTAYVVDCSCPAATCTCMETFGQGGGSSGGGSSSGGLPFSGCMSGCGPTAVMPAFKACGFPLPQP